MELSHQMLLIADFLRKLFFEHYYNDGLGEVIHEPKDAFPDNFATQFSWDIEGDSISLFSISSEIFLFREKSIKLKVKKTKENELRLLTPKNKNGLRNLFEMSRP